MALNSRARAVEPDPASGRLGVFLTLQDAAYIKAESKTLSLPSTRLLGMMSSSHIASLLKGSSLSPPKR